MKLTVKLSVEEGAKTPTYAHKGDAGMDIYSFEDLVLQPLERKLVRTGIKIAIPYGYEAQVRPKSGLAINHGIVPVNTPGTIDCSYRGEIMVPLINFSNEPYTVTRGQKIAQMVFAKVEEVVFEKTETLDETPRGSGGFGSTGL